MLNPDQEQQLKTITILYVEDEDMMRANLAILLGRKIRTVELAANGQEGVEKFQQCNPDLIITDLEMPVMNGLEMIERIREINRDVPIIILTAFSDDTHQSKHASARLIKPVMKNDLFQAILNCLP